MKKKEIKYWLVHERCFCLLLWQCTQETKKKKSISLLSLSLFLYITFHLLQLFLLHFLKQITCCENFYLMPILSHLTVSSLSLLSLSIDTYSYTYIYIYIHIDQTNISIFECLTDGSNNFHSPPKPYDSFFLLFKLHLHANYVVFRSIGATFFIFSHLVSFFVFFSTIL